MKRPFLLACLIVLVALAPQRAKAEDDDREDSHRHHIRATEMAGMGLGAAALVGVAGYLLLRKRHSA